MNASPGKKSRRFLSLASMAERDTVSERHLVSHLSALAGGFQRGGMNQKMRQCGLAFHVDCYYGYKLLHLVYSRNQLHWMLLSG